MRDDKDRSIKWMLEHHGGGILRLGGVTGFRSWRAAQPEVVQPRALPDGLLEVFFLNRVEPDAVLVEVATYPDRRVAEQVLRDLALVYADRRVLPEVITLVLHPLGTSRLSGEADLTSQHGWTRLRCTWRLVEMWTLAAADLLAVGDVGLVPWVPLTQFEGTPEALIQQCRERIDRQAAANERANLLAVTQVMARLRFQAPGLLALLGGTQMIIESPLIQELLADRMHRSILAALEVRFGAVDAELSVALRSVMDQDRLDDLHRFAVICPDIATFRARLAQPVNGG